MDFQKITVGRFPTLENRRRRYLSSEKLSPQSLQMAPRNPPGGGIDYVTLHRSRIEGSTTPGSEFPARHRGASLGNTDLWYQEKRGSPQGSSLFLGTKNQ